MQNVFVEMNSEHATRIRNDKHCLDSREKTNLAFFHCQVVAIVTLPPFAHPPLLFYI